ncbi:MAG: hypothetical protein KDA75_15265 [Planctomycetaceae bacterium]|nr:hypothetical protein [Planctomycetaceae bacterium]
MLRESDGRSRFTLAITLLATFTGIVPAGWRYLPADDEPDREQPDLATLVANADGIDPSGRPNNYGIGEPSRYYVWHDNQGWHLRCTSPKGKAYGYKGRLRLHKATFLAVRPIGVDKREDSYGVNRAKDELAFKFLTGAQFDGVDFNVKAEDDAKIEFELFCFGKKTPKRIFIGASAGNPKAHQFALDADP